ncbi:Antitoxin igA-2 (plasmid) [Piscirickettsia salmonis]|uniref:helix-turn-helix domain-containing protein n=1 Tax=Piscirickettsia salmonis TaxID=1238 RepID=UPI001E533C78|nr:helix-turn-helix domain-containing protein [Piscirickettsia salmonis]QGP57233.1 Antitoxin igA-2 [Piscirickettsia salmonis]QGP62090.1 Antitoxin igA-2 [Piscirickettsia salmonis]QGP66766.1 Antitoxin igA-2 [Piscirickettsia salmonis]
MSDILNVLSESMSGLHQSGIVDKITADKFKQMAVKVPKVRKYSAAQIKKLRKKFKLSQPVFAEFLNVAPSTLKKWEQGDRCPSGPSLRLLNLVEKGGIDLILLGSFKK